MSESHLVAQAQADVRRPFGMDSFLSMFPRAVPVIVRHESVRVTHVGASGERERTTVPVPIHAWTIRRGDGTTVLAMVEPTALDQHSLAAAAATVSAIPAAATVNRSGCSVDFRELA